MTHQEPGTLASSLRWIGLVLPGWQGPRPDHWTTDWADAYGYQVLEQSDWDNPLRGDWQIALEEKLLKMSIAHQAERTHESFQVVLMAHGLACHLVSAWAQHSRHVAWIKAAWLVEPVDLIQADAPLAWRSWRTPLSEAIPFPTQVLFSSDDPLCSVSQAQALAQRWGSRCQSAADIEHSHKKSAGAEQDALHQNMLDYIKQLN